MKNILNLKCYKSPGFILSAVGVLLLIVSVIVYATFNGTLLEYHSNNVLLPSLLGIVLYAVLVLLKPSEKYASLVLWASSFIALLLYINNVYMYFTGVFYNGVTAEAMKIIDARVIVSAVTFIAASIVSNVAMYLKNSPKEAD